MRIAQTFSPAVASALFVTSIYAADARVVVPHTSTEACTTLQAQLAKIEGQPGGKPYKYWFCDHWDAYSTPEYYVIALWSRPAPGSGIDHNQSAGHFAVSKLTGKLRYFDLATEEVVDIPDVYYAKPKDQSKPPQSSSKSTGGNN